MSEETISVLVAPEAPKMARDVADKMILTVPIEKELPIDELTKNISDILIKCSKVVDRIPDSLGNYMVDNVSVSLSISATGNVSILGIGGSLGGQAGITVTLTKSKK